MFPLQSPEPVRRYRGAFIGLLLLSVAATGVTLWLMVDFINEQATVGELIDELPAESKSAARSLVGELEWQFRLTMLVVINLVATGVAVVLLWRAYQTSQDSLRDVKALAGDILSSIDQAVITIDMDGRVTSFNARAMQLFELQGDPVGTPLAGLTEKIDLQAFCEDVNQHPGMSKVQDFYVPFAEGQRCLRGFCQPLSDIAKQTIGTVIQLRDVTDQIHIENQVRRMERFMGLGSVAAGLHHEIKNPLAALSLHIQLLEEQLDDPDARDEIEKAMQVIKTEIARVGSVLEGFRDFASIENLQLAEVNLPELIQRQLDLIRPKAEQHRVRLRWECDEQADVALQLDRVRIEQVLLNLMLNAIQAMPSGGTLEIRCEPTQLSGEPALAIHVSDSGNGIPESSRPRVFDAYFTTKGDGTGMGLALSDKIVRQHGGSLDFTTSTAGTTFTMILPINRMVA
ncbi:two-component system sensor histidine kinase NtrB [Stieleria varia]|uniref:histidine kinase n=1 Tax=Stieleria varia TaxID=2528005 RepID=A0A5C6B8W5_9BACT|nr:ATP-binding protein [Stieleria varia]TWU08167.1 Sensor protein ZraS [Stieleria varia]